MLGTRMSNIQDMSRFCFLSDLSEPSPVVLPVGVGPLHVTCMSPDNTAIDPWVSPVTDCLCRSIHVYSVPGNIVPLFCNLPYLGTYLL